MRRYIEEKRNMNRKVMAFVLTVLLVALSTAPAAMAKTQSDDIVAGKKMVALTFDDGPNGNTSTVLNVLEKYNARATFFVQGKSVRQYAATERRAVELGCEIGNHSWNHKNLTTISAGDARRQISETNDVIESVTGLRPVLVRPPYGSMNSTVRSVARAEGASLVLWSVDTLDWKTRNANSTFNAATRGARDGAIILMHDIHYPTGQAVKRIVPWLIDHGYQLVTVSELATYRSTTLRYGSSYRRIVGKPFQPDLPTAFGTKLKRSN